MAGSDQGCSSQTPGEAEQALRKLVVLFFRWGQSTQHGIQSWEFHLGPQQDQPSL